MGLLDNVKSVLTQYAAGAAPAGDAGAHFEQVAQSVDAGSLAQGIAAAMRSDQTPPFAQLASQLFASGSGDQKMAMINTLLSSVSPEQRAQISALIPGLSPTSSVTGTQAAAISPAAIQALAQHVEQHEPGIVEGLSPRGRPVLREHEEREVHDGGRRRQGRLSRSEDGFEIEILTGGLPWAAVAPPGHHREENDENDEGFLHRRTTLVCPRIKIPVSVHACCAGHESHCVPSRRQAWR